jgi:hypothetical protein
MRELIEALRQSFLEAMHVDEMWHPDWAAVSKIRCFAALQILRTPLVETARQWPYITLNVADFLAAREVAWGRWPPKPQG